MFNRGKFNIQRFNLPEKQAVIYVRDVMTACMESLTELQYDVHFTLEAEEAVEGGLVIGCKVYVQEAQAEAVNAATILVADYHTTEAQAETCGASVKLVLNCHVKDKLGAEFNASADIGENIHLHEALSDAVRISSVLNSKYTTEEIACYAIMNALVSTAVFDTAFAVIDVSIPSGGKLVLDSENFVALLNNANVLDKHSGAWVELTRNVVEIKVDNGSTAQLEINMLYTERYL